MLYPRVWSLYCCRESRWDKYMYCSTSSVNLPRVKIHSVVTYVSWPLSANGNDTFCEKALKYKCVWIIQITSHYLEPLESLGASLQNFLSWKIFPNSFVLAHSRSQGQTAPRLSHLCCWKGPAAIYHHEGVARAEHARSMLPASGAVGVSRWESMSGNQKGCMWHNTSLSRQPKELRLL